MPDCRPGSAHSVAPQGQDPPGASGVPAQPHLGDSGRSAAPLLPMHRGAREGDPAELVGGVRGQPRIPERRRPGPDVGVLHGPGHGGSGSQLFTEAQSLGQAYVICELDAAAEVRGGAWGPVMGRVDGQMDQVGGPIQDVDRAIVELQRQAMRLQCLPGPRCAHADPRQRAVQVNRGTVRGHPVVGVDAELTAVSKATQDPLCGSPISRRDQEVDVARDSVDSGQHGPRRGALEHDRPDSAGLHGSDELGGESVVASGEVARPALAECLEDARRRLWNP